MSGNRPKSSRRKGRKSNPRSRYTHLSSSVEFTLNLKSTPKKRELYPITVGQCFNPESVGVDTDIRLIGYVMTIIIASGNDTNTVQLNLSHAGPWVRRGSTDGFNQQFSGTRQFRRKSVTFTKRVLPQSEREYISPQGDVSNKFILQLDDPCGVVPGATLLVKVRMHFIRPHVPTSMAGAGDLATDLYSDQNVDTGASPVPPSALADIPSDIFKAEPFAGTDFTTSDTSSPYEYRNSSDSDVFTIVLTGTVRKTGRFTLALGFKDSEVQNLYTAAGFYGNIAIT